MRDLLIESASRGRSATRIRRRRSVAAAVFSLLLGSKALPACAGTCDSPLILDLDGGGIETTSYLTWPVRFDLDGDGLPELVAWTSPATEEAFLWLDLNRNGRVDSGLELFGNNTPLPGGGAAGNGFLALALFDDPAFGGDGDGQITPFDLIWSSLRLWIDTDHDGVSQQRELFSLDAKGVTELGLGYREQEIYDRNWNLHLFHGQFVRVYERKYSRPFRRSQGMEDVFFHVRPAGGD